METKNRSESSGVATVLNFETARCSYQFWLNANLLSWILKAEGNTRWCTLEDKLDRYPTGKGVAWLVRQSNLVLYPKDYTFILAYTFYKEWLCTSNCTSFMVCCCNASQMLVSSSLWLLIQYTILLLRIFL